MAGRNNETKVSSQACEVAKLPKWRATATDGDGGRQDRDLPLALCAAYSRATERANAQYISRS